VLSLLAQLTLQPKRSKAPKVALTNYLEPEHIEKIVSAYRAFEDIPGFARVVSREERAENDDNPQHPALRRHDTTT
jgi:type I restriction-modification system DNA methylase subunit